MKKIIKWIVLFDFEPSFRPTGRATLSFSEKGTEINFRPTENQFENEI